MSVCCWPCVCDLQEFVKADTLEVETREGRSTLDVLVIGEALSPQDNVSANTASSFSQWYVKSDRSPGSPDIPN